MRLGGWVGGGFCLEVRGGFYCLCLVGGGGVWGALSVDGVVGVVGVGSIEGGWWWVV